MNDSCMVSIIHNNVLIDMLVIWITLCFVKESFGCCMVCMVVYT